MTEDHVARKEWESGLVEAEAEVRLAPMARLPIVQIGRHEAATSYADAPSLVRSGPRG